ncbi:MAG TPA: sigma-70 family RNA polymerase sigma factor [Puia sp.]|nr:sigma-70 family RNA polymerase sigma factor [Puia sp.]
MKNKTGNHLTDSHLVDKVLRGDTHAFGLIIKNTEGLVAQIVYKMIGNPEDRKDIAQDVYLKAFSKLGGFRFQSKLSTWIARIAYNTCLSWLEKKKLVFPGDGYDGQGTGETMERISDRTVAGGHGEQETLMSRKELSVILQGEIDRLPAIYKILLTLYHQEELSYAEIVEVTQLPEGTVKSYLFRARKALKDGLSVNYKMEEL